jgi:hypothetical protein
MLKTMIAVVAVFAAFLFAPAPATAATSSLKGFRLIAPLSGPVGKGKSDYRETQRAGKTVRTLKVEIEKGKAGDTYEIRVNGQFVKNITLNSFGFAEVEMRSKTDDPSKVGTVPVIKSGDSITVGPYSGIYAPKK